MYLIPYLFNLESEAVMPCTWTIGLNNSEADMKLDGNLVNNLRFSDDIGLLTTSGTEL